MINVENIWRDFVILLPQLIYKVWVIAVNENVQNSISIKATTDSMKSFREFS